MSSLVFIEYQADSGVWLQFCTCSNHASDITRMLNACLKSQSWIKKARAIDSTTRQVIDLSFK